MTFTIMLISIAIHFAPRIYALEFWFILQSLISQDCFFLEYGIEHVAIGFLSIKFVFSTRVCHMGVRALYLMVLAVFVAVN